MTVREDMERRIKEARAEGTVSGRMLAIVIEDAKDKVDEETLNREIEDDSTKA